jgi:hypothetical protein
MERSYGGRRCQTTGVRAVCGDAGSAGRLGDGASVAAVSPAEENFARGSAVASNPWLSKFCSLVAFKVIRIVAVIAYLHPFAGVVATVLTGES